MKDKYRFFIVAMLSLVLTFMIVFSVEIVRLERGGPINVDYTNSSAARIFISSFVYSELPYRYSLSYPREYAVCLYGNIETDEVTILDSYVPNTFEQTTHSVGFICQSSFKGHKYIGSVHSHPDSSWCVLSDVDMSSKEPVMGVQCSEDKILFYLLSDGYTTGYYAQVS